jgi:sec-independent protein translocase protein TatC
LLFGIAFVLPVVLVLLNFMGLLSANAILKGWRLAVVISAFIGALSTPVADPTSMFLLMVPLLVLYFVALGIAALRDRFTNRKKAKMLAEYGIDEAAE